jgi:hypothetical protein
MNRIAVRRVYSTFMVGVAGFCTLLAAGVLAAVIFYVIENGSHALTPAFPGAESQTRSSALLKSSRSRRSAPCR